MNHEIKTSIAPWLTVSHGEKAIAFYKSAFKAVETYRLNDPEGGLVARLSINGAEFWISGESVESKMNAPLGGNNIRMILTVDDPYACFSDALEAGAKEIFPVGEDHGWLLGRLSDPFGLHWEVGHQL